MVRRWRIGHYDLPFDSFDLEALDRVAQGGGESFDSAQDREPVERLVEPFGICYLFKIENLVLMARLEVIGSAIDKICLWFQVSGVSKYRILNTELVATEDPHR